MTDYTQTTKQQLPSGITLKHTIQGHGYRIYSVAWSPDENYLASGSLDHTIRIWDAQTGSRLNTLSVLDLSVFSVAWSPNGKSLASGSRDDNIGLWNAQTWEIQRVLKGHTAIVSV